MKKVIVAILVLIAILALAAGLAVLDRVLSRPDRIAAARKVDEMITVRDQVLRYQLDHGSLPHTLGELVPGYLRLDQIAAAGKPLYVYDPAARQLRQSAGSRVKGVFRHDHPPTEMAISPGESDATAPAIAPVETKDILDGGIAVLPRGLDLPEPPRGCYVFEAEHFSRMNWGWEIHPDPKAGGGAYIHSWEGITNGPAQIEYGIWNFYDVHTKSDDYTVLRYYFHLPKSGSYYIYGRMWTTDTHCSNAVCAAIDTGGPREGHMENRDPFEWIWSEVAGNPYYLDAGDHFLHIYIHEDGLRIDQFILSPRPIYEGGPWRENLVTGKDTAWQKKAGAAVHLSFDVKRQVISPATPPEVNVVLRRFRPSAAKAALRVTLEGAGLGGTNWRVWERAIDLSKMPELCFVPLSFADMDLSMLDRREYLLRAELISGGKTIAEARVTLLRPFDWQVLGPLDFLRNDRPGPFDGAANPGPSDSRRWVPLKESSMEHFGVLDFGLHTAGNSANAPSNAAIYARTRVNFPKSDDYLFLMQSDDQMLFWIDGKLVYRFDETDGRPVTRSAERSKIHVDAGDHEIRMRVNQRYGPWQASVRIRTKGDDISNVVGLPRPAAEPSPALPAAPAAVAPK